MSKTTQISHETTHSSLPRGTLTCYEGVKRLEAGDKCKGNVQNLCNHLNNDTNENNSGFFRNMDDIIAGKTSKHSVENRPEAASALLATICYCRRTMTLVRVLDSRSSIARMEK